MMSAPSDGLPESKRHLFFLILWVAGTSVVLWNADIWLIGLLEIKTLPEALRTHIGVARSVVENLIAGAIAAILLALGSRWVISAFDSGDRVIELPPGSITTRLLRNAVETRTYVFMGNTASFVTAAILPVLVDSARRSGHPRAVKLFVMDPTDTKAVESYVAHRDRVARGESKDADRDLARWIPPQVTGRMETPVTVKAKVLAALYLAAYASLHSGMEVSVYLRRSFAPSRVDMSDREVVLTQESKQEAAVAFSARGHFYGWYQKEADAQRGQAEPLNLSASRDELRKLLLPPPSSSREELRAGLRLLLQSFTHLHSLANDVAALENAAELVRRPGHSY